MPALGDEQIRGLDVAMHDAFGVRGVKRIGNFNRKLEQKVGLERLPPDAVLKRDTFQVLHDDEGFAILLVNFMDGADIRMVQGRGGPRLTLETL